MIPVFVPSYGRPKATFLSRSPLYKFPLYVFVRKEQAEQYRWIKSRDNTRLVLLNNVTNIGQTRAAMIRYAMSRGIDKVFMIDDDVSRLDISVWDDDKQTVRASGTVLGRPEDWNKALQTWEHIWEDEALLGASYRPYSWSMKKEDIQKKPRAQLQQCVGVNVRLLKEFGLNYRDSREVGNEDLFLQLECIQHGLATTKTNLIQYDCPSMGTGNGGCNLSEDGTIQEKQIRRVKLFLEACNNSDLVVVKETKSGVPSIKFNWGLIPERR